MRPFPHNWASGAEVSTEWQTDVVTAGATGAEERRGLVARPRRTIQVSWSGWTPDDAQRLLFRLLRLGDEETDVPLYPDATRTTDEASDTAVPCDTEHRRFHVGHRVLIYPATAPEDAVVGVIAAVDEHGLTLEEALAEPIAAGAVVVPLLRVQTILDAELRAHTDYVATVDVGLSEVLVSALPALADLDDLPALGFSAGPDGYYVLTLGPEWGAGVTLRARRAGSVVTVGRDQVVARSGPRPLLDVSYEFLGASREQVFRALAFADAHRGRLVPFLVVNPLTVFRALAISSTYVEVAPAGDLADLEDFVDYVALETTSGPVVRKVAAVTVVDGRWRIGVTANWPALTLDQVRRATTAHLCRFAADALEEAWATDGVARLRFDVVEVVNDVSVAEEEE